MAIPATASELRLAGILRPYYSAASLRGWALVPPVQHGGFAAMRLIPLPFEEATRRAVLDGERGRRLRYTTGGDAVFELERDHAALTAPPRRVRDGRYLYVGGRRRPAPEPWMLR